MSGFSHAPPPPPPPPPPASDQQQRYDNPINLKGAPPPHTLRHPPTATPPTVCLCLVCAQ